MEAVPSPSFTRSRFNRVGQRFSITETCPIVDERGLRLTLPRVNYNSFKKIQLFPFFFCDAEILQKCLF